VNTQWSRTDQRWYLSVRCRKCHSPILFAVDHSDGSQGGTETQPSAMLVLTCTIDECKHRADYTDAVVIRLQKSPADVAAPRMMTSGKNGKRKV